MREPNDAAPKARPGYFITLEGGDGTGKSTQAELLAQWVTERYGGEVVRTFEPGDTKLGRQLRQLIQHGDHMADRTEALLFAADRAQHVAEVVRPALARGAVVVCDRYLDSSVAYQGAGRALPAGEIYAISRWAAADLQPNATVLLDLPAEQALARLSDRPADRLESAGVEFQQKVRAGYRKLADQDPERWIVVPADGSISHIANQIRAALEPRLAVSLQ